MDDFEPSLWGLFLSNFILLGPKVQEEEIPPFFIVLNSTLIKNKSAFYLILNFLIWHIHIKIIKFWHFVERIHLFLNSKWGGQILKLEYWSRHLQFDEKIHLFFNHQQVKLRSYSMTLMRGQRSSPIDFKVKRLKKLFSMSVKPALGLVESGQVSNKLLFGNIMLNGVRGEGSIWKVRYFSPHKKYQSTWLLIFLF